MASRREVVVPDQTLAGATVQLTRFSIGISERVDRVLGTSSNHEVQVLVHLYLNPPQRPRDLMAVTGLTRPSVAMLVGRLERLGLVDRVFGADDRRTVLTSLTTRGRRRMRRMEAELESFFEETREQIVELLVGFGCQQARPPLRREEDSALAIAGRLGAVGAAMEAQYDPVVHGLRRRQRDALSALLAHGAMRAGELAEALRLSSGGLTYLMDQLVADGFVVRSHGRADDRRAVVIDLSDAGRAAAQSTVLAARACAGEMCEALRLALVPRPAAPV